MKKLVRVLSRREMRYFEHIATQRIDDGDTRDFKTVLIDVLNKAGVWVFS